MKLRLVKVNVFVLFALSIILFSCGKTGKKATVTHVPVQLKANGNWSLLNVETGAIVYEGEFKKMPSVVVEGVFTTRKENGELFYNKMEDEKKFKQIAGPFKSGSLMSEGIAIVCKEESHPSAINASGNEVFSLEPQNGVVFSSVGRCIEGLIKFQADNGFWGVLDKEGKIVCKPQFDFIDDFDNGFARVSLHTDSKNKLGIIDKSGKLVLDIDRAYVGKMVGGRMVYSDTKDEFGILAVSPTEMNKLIGASSKYEGISLVGNDIFYKSDKEWGLMNEKGEVQIRAKYQSLSRLNDDVLLGIKVDGDDVVYELMNNKGEVTKKDDVDGGVDYGIFNLRNGNFIVKDGKDFQLMNAKGEMVGNNAVKDWYGVRDIVLIQSNFSEIVESDYFDWGKLKEYIGSVKTGSMGGFNLGVNCIQANTALQKITVSAKGENTEEDKGRGMVFEVEMIGWKEHNGVFGFYIGNGYETENQNKADNAAKTEAAPSEDDVASERIEDSSESSGSSQTVVDNAPDWSTSQTGLYRSINLGKSGSIEFTLGFDEYLKKAKTSEVAVDNGYTSYTEERIVGYEPNAEAKLISIVMEINIQADKKEKLKKLIDGAFAKGFQFQGELYGVKRYTDATGNKWEINDGLIRLNAAVAEYDANH